MVVWMGLLFLERTDGREGSEFRTKQLNLLNQLIQRGNKNEFGYSLTIVKVKSVEVHPLHQIPQPLRLERGQTRIADLPVNTCRSEHHPLNITFLTHNHVSEEANGL